MDAGFIVPQEGKAYFFSNKEYIRYNYTDVNITGNIDPGYPKPILGNFSKDWPQGWTEVDASYYDPASNKVYFFRGQEYARYTFKGIGITGEIDPGYPKQILGNFSSNWPTSWTKIDAAIYDPDSMKVYFMKGNEYFRYSFEGAGITGSVDVGYPKPIVGHFSSNWMTTWNGTTAAFLHSKFDKAYFFSDAEYLRYSFLGAGITGSMDTGYPKRVDGNFSANWPDTWTCDWDGDGFTNREEIHGIDSNADGLLDLDLAALGANPLRKDLFVELDFMDCAVQGGDCNAGELTDYGPNPLSIQEVVNAFAAAPVNNPDGSSGINLIVQIDDAVPRQEFCDFASGCFDAYKSNFFGTVNERTSANSVNILAAKNQVFRYCLWVNALSSENTTSGLANFTSSSIVSLGLWDPAPTEGQQIIREGGTFMHEIGHNLGLGHGGGDGINCKPNYLSIMSYAFQVIGIPPNNVLDYSFEELPSLNEANLDESMGIQSMSPYNTLYSNLDMDIESAFSSGPIDWNGDGDLNDLGIQVDINASCGSSPGEVLEGYNDWNNLDYSFRDNADFITGVYPPEVQEINYEQYLELLNTITSRRENLEDVNLTVYPNPVDDELFIEFISKKSLNLELRILNNLGQIKFRKDIKIVTGDNKIKLDISAMPSGFYLVQIGRSQSISLIKR